MSACWQIHCRKKVEGRWRLSDWRQRPLEHFQVRYAATNVVAIRKVFMEFAEVIYRDESTAEMDERIGRLAKAKEEEWGESNGRRFANLFYYSPIREPEMVQCIEEFVKACNDCAFWSVCVRIGMVISMIGLGTVKWTCCNSNAIVLCLQQPFTQTDNCTSSDPKMYDYQHS